MKDLKHRILTALKFKDEISALLQAFRPGDIEQDLLILPDSLLNEAFRKQALRLTGGRLKSYRVLFDRNRIFLHIQADARQLGPVSVRWEIDVREFRFDPSVHKIYASFTEEAVSEGNMAQKLALKAATTGGSLLKTALRLSGTGWIYADKNNLYLDLDQAPFADRIPPNLSLTWTSCAEGRLIFRFHTEDAAERSASF